MPRAPHYFTLSSPLFVSTRARKRPIQRREGTERETNGTGNERVGRRAGSFRAQMRALAPSLPVLAMIKEVLSIHSIYNSKKSANNIYISIIIRILTFLKFIMVY